MTPSAPMMIAPRMAPFLNPAPRDVWPRLISTRRTEGVATVTGRGHPPTACTVAGVTAVTRPVTASAASVHNRTR